MEVKKVAIYINKQNSLSLKSAKTLATNLESTKIKSYLTDKDIKEFTKDTDLIFCIGGDGTLLSAAQKAAKLNIKIVGINSGNLGFLAALKTQEDFTSVLQDLLKDNFTKKV